MTIAAALGGELRKDRPEKEEERLFQTTNDTSVLGYCAWQESRKEAGTVILMHGLTGDADDSYVRGTALKAYEHGFNTVRLNSRNCGGTRQLTPSIYHMGLTADMNSVLRELGEKDCLPRLYFGGFSMGANISLKLAGEWKDQTPNYIRGLFAVSPPLDIAGSSRAISQGFVNRCYELKFLQDLKELIEEKSQLFPEKYQTTKLSSVKTLRDFDRDYVAPCFGFHDEDDYYDKASCGPFVDNISLPVLVIHAEDDPLIPIEPIRSWKNRARDNVHFLITKCGGHVGFIGKTPLPKMGVNDSDRYWAENRIVQFLRFIEQK